MFQPMSRDEYHKKLNGKKVFGKDDCPFCDTNTQKEHTIWKWKYWYILHNLAPYSWDHRHIMAVLYDHICFSKDLSFQHLQEMQEIHKVVENFFWNETYFSFTRETMANRSVEHLHIHFLAWKLQWKFLRKMLELQGFPIKQDLNIN